MAMAQEARKPMFLLRAADGAIGGHQAAVKECGEDFRALARDILKRTDRAEGLSNSLSVVAKR
jgi:hypothetical protein